MNTTLAIGAQAKTQSPITQSQLDTWKLAVARSRSGSTVAHEGRKPSLGGPGGTSLTTNGAGTPGGAPSGDFVCMWAVQPGEPCRAEFTDPDDFYAHLAEVHVGRKSRGNLSLNCLWIGCSHGHKPFSKRDHIVSHCRAHVPFKANVCIECNAQFKWPQDLKKHCLKQGHAFVDPPGKNEKPGPSMIVTDAGTGAAHIREGPRLTGGPRKLSKARTPSSSGQATNRSVRSFEGVRHGGPYEQHLQPPNSMLGIASPNYAAGALLSLAGTLRSDSNNGDTGMRDIADRSLMDPNSQPPLANSSNLSYAHSRTQFQIQEPSGFGTIPNHTQGLPPPPSEGYMRTPLHQQNYPMTTVTHVGNIPDPAVQSPLMHGTRRHVRKPSENRMHPFHRLLPAVRNPSVPLQHDRLLAYASPVLVGPTAATVASVVDGITSFSGVLPASPALYHGRPNGALPQQSLAQQHQPAHVLKEIEQLMQPSPFMKGPMSAAVGGVPGSAVADAEAEILAAVDGVMSSGFGIDLVSDFGMIGGESWNGEFGKARENDLF